MGPAEIVNTLRRMRGPFNINAGALAAAEAAVLDVQYVDKCRAENAKWRDWLTDELVQAGILVDASETNFILARFDSVELADAADDRLKTERADCAAGKRVINCHNVYGLPSAKVLIANVWRRFYVILWNVRGHQGSDANL